MKSLLRAGSTQIIVLVSGTGGRVARQLDLFPNSCFPIINIWPYGIRSSVYPTLYWEEIHHEVHPT